MIKMFRIIDKILRYFGYCLVAEINTDNYQITNIFIDKV